MKPKHSSVALRYSNALEAHLKQGRGATYQTAQEIGHEAAAAGLHPLELTRLHERTLVTTILPRCRRGDRARCVKRASTYLTVALLQGPRAKARGGDGERVLERAIETLSARTVQLAASNGSLKLMIDQRRAAAKALKKSESHYRRSLKRSRRLQQQLRGLSRQLLSAHEDERRRISLELHDVVAQTLTGISLQLATLSTETAGSSTKLARNIVRTQRLVEHSVKVVHQFARELRPTVLDDLGLIPALHSLLKAFSVRTGIRAHLSVFAAVEKLDMGRRTVLFRVAQEALTNVGRHSRASQVEVSIQRSAGFVTMRISDDGKSFNARAVLEHNAGKRLGLLGMRERVEMLSGTFSVESSPGNGAAVTARIPVRDRRPQAVNS